MSVPAILVTIVLMISAVLLILAVLVQSGKSEGLSGTLVGSSAAESFLGQNRSHTWDAKIARATKWLAGIFVVCAFLLNLL